MKNDDLSHSPRAALQNMLNYLREAAALNEIPQPGIAEETAPPAFSPGQILQKQYWKLDPAQVEESATALYLAPQLHPIAHEQEMPLIFPFGINESQLEAVRQAMTSQLSVIQGPPGTGKTQTILNIIANLLMRNLTVQVVSGTNSATANVQEKLSSPDIGLAFLTAFLGSRHNKEMFIQQQTEKYPDISDWQMEPEPMKKLLASIESLTLAVSQTFAAQKRLARAREEYRAVQLEQSYFEKFLQEEARPVQPVRLRTRTRTEALLRLWMACELAVEEDHPLSFWLKLRGRFLSGIGSWAFYRLPPADIIRSLKEAYYRVRLQELEQEIAQLTDALSRADIHALTDRLTAESRRYLHAVIYERFRTRLPYRRRQFFSFNPSSVRSRNNFCTEYPVVLSTTFSSRSSLPHTLYDFLIMDEASQVDIASGTLALTGARRAVIAGDTRQLPNVVPSRLRWEHEALFRRYQIPDGYFAGRESFLSSLVKCVPQLPQTLLREHYRCHPDIINFCNQEYYNNELLIMTEAHGEKDVLRLVQTVPGHHGRQHVNQRQIDVIRSDVLPALRSVPAEDIGIVSPYRDQVYQIRQQLAGPQLLAENVSTVHKFQGREKDTIIITTVDDIITPFSDDPHLLNVAVSRARRHLIVVASPEEQPEGSHVRDLMAYIRYHGGQLLHSDVRSVFDLLYRQYAEERQQFLARHTAVSSYVSENLMYGLIEDILKTVPELHLAAVPHVPLLEIFSRPQRSLLSMEEQGYIQRGAHVDFLLYHTIRKIPVFAIEVDGFRFHQKGTRQFDRDRMKDHIFQTLRLPLLRFSTTGSNEEKQLRDILQRYIQTYFHADLSH